MSRRILAPLTAMRQCGSCHACCILPSVGAPGFEKGGGVRCSKLKKNGRCGVYNKRPDECRDFKCAWLAGMMPPDFDLPPRELGLMVGATEIDGFTVLTVYEVWKGAASTHPPAKRFFDMMRAKTLVILIDNHLPDPKTIITGPPHMHEDFLLMTGRQNLVKNIMGILPKGATSLTIEIPHEPNSASKSRR